jgi:hypothetical protein
MNQHIAEERLWSQIVAKAWCDDGFMMRLQSEPRAVLAEHRMEVPEGMEVKIVQGTEVKVVADSDTVCQLILPFSPPGELMEEGLSGDIVAYCACGACGRCGGCGCRCRC